MKAAVLNTPIYRVFFACDGTNESVLRMRSKRKRKK
jgi:hypothetical protein